MWKRGGSNPFSMISIVIATYWLTVFHFARREAGTITPTEAATARSPVTASSRPTITTTIHASILSIARSETSAAATSSLSAIGSSSVPSVVTWLRRRATTPSAQSVIAARMKIPAAIAAWTREDEIRNTISSGTATMRVRVRPIGRFMRLRPRGASTASLSAARNDLVNARQVPRHERRGVEDPARGHVRAPARRLELLGPRRVDGEACHLAAVAPPLADRLQGRRAQRDPGRQRPHALDEKPRAHVVLERAPAPLPGAHDDEVAPLGHRPVRRGREVHERGDADRGRLARRQQGPGAVARRQHDGAAAHALACELERRVPQIEPGDRLAPPLAREERAVGGGAPPGLDGIGHGRDPGAAGREGRDDRGRGAQHVDDEHGRTGEPGGDDGV